MALGDYELLTDLQSEILGILFGDGSLSATHSSVQIVITGHKLDDREYLIGHARPMFARLFGKLLKVRMRKNENTMDLYTYSKRVALTLHEWGMPFGRKKLFSFTPKVALEEGSFVRGLFDTDGCVYNKYGPYVQIQFESASGSLLAYVKKCLVNLAFIQHRLEPMTLGSGSFSADRVKYTVSFVLSNPKIRSILSGFEVLRGDSFRYYRHASEHQRDLEPTKPYRNNFRTKPLVGLLREPSSQGAVV